MKFITNIINKLRAKDIPVPLGRWRLKQCNVQMIHKIDLSNEDHCGPCGQYALKKVKLKNEADKDVKSTTTN